MIGQRGLLGQQILETGALLIRFVDIGRGTAGMVAVQISLPIQLAEFLAVALELLYLFGGCRSLHGFGTLIGVILFVERVKPFFQNRIFFQFLAHDGFQFHAGKL